MKTAAPVDPDFELLESLKEREQAQTRRDQVERRFGRAATLMASIVEMERLAAPFRDAALDQALRQAEARLMQQLVDARVAFRKLGDAGTVG